MKNVTVKYFNSFENILSFIYVQTLSAQIVLRNIVLEQFSLSQSMIICQSTPNLNISITNLTVLKYNSLQVKNIF